MPETKMCPVCKNELVYKSGNSKRNGKPYAFWGCSNYPVCEYTEQAPKTPQIARQSVNSPTGNADVVNALRNIYELLDSGLPSKETFPEPPEDTTEEDLAKFNILP